MTIVLIFILFDACHKEKPNPTIYQTNFDSGTGWSNVTSGPPTLIFVRDHYEISVGIAGEDVWAYAPCGLISTNYSMSADFSIRLSDNTKSGYVGFVFNYFDGDNYELFRISNGGYFDVLKKSLGAEVILNSWTASSVIIQGVDMTNRLEIDQLDNSVDFKINGQSLGSFPYVRALSFRVGLLAATGTGTDFTSVTGSFDNLIIKKFP